MITGQCHCGTVRFHLALPSREVELLDCNCSMCRRSGYLHLIVRHDNFHLISGGEALTSYRFGTGAANHLFCAKCGVKSFYQPRSHPDAWSVNFNCLNDGHNITATIRKFDGRDWEAARADLA
jgi:hypothetical protein